MDMASDEHLQRFQKESDRAFLAMQVTADREMETFLRQYSDDTALSSFQTPDFHWGTASVEAVTGAPGRVAATARKKLRAAADRVEQTAAKALPKIRASQATSYEGVADLGGALKDDLAAAGEDAVADARGWLRQTTMDLGERARREAAAMRDAARKAMEEENSLRGLKERARNELRAAKARVKEELIDAKSDALSDLESLAVEKLQEVGGHGIAAAEAAQKKAALEIDDLLGGGQR